MSDAADQSMVERVARALSDNLQAALPDGVAVDYRYAARAAITAMRELTPAMEQAYGLVLWPTGYRATIDAALKD